MILPVGLKLFDEVLNHAPGELTLPERVFNMILAWKIMDDDPARTVRLDPEVLAGWMGYRSVRRLTQVCERLEKRGYQIRKPTGVDSLGRVLHVDRDGLTTYHLPLFEEENPFHASFRPTR